MTRISPLAGLRAEPTMLINVPQLISAYYTGHPDSAVPAQRVAFGTSGHRGSAFTHSFNEAHILAVSQAICWYRQKHDISGPLFLGDIPCALRACFYYGAGNAGGK